ncbi:hypothetical protein AB835_14945 [Candidatus Endobugula sertula]|uniref:Uncharacterized protein n=1 Tax=Candidatus Endobugula sertula TaxID=62101 RepID=A0A1D2QL63_9GAMM|nr:hypothetical protein AB835_14945 [Candidatus Endobugula sertula]
MNFVFLIVLAAVIGGFCLFFLNSSKRKLQARESLSSSDLLSIYVSSEGDIRPELFAESLEKVSEIFSVPVDKLRLEDVIGRDIGRRFPLSAGDSISTEDFYEYIHSQKVEANIAYEDPVNTVADFVKFEDFIHRKKKA